MFSDFDNNDVPHFILKTPKGTEKLHVNKNETVVSALHYSLQLQSVFIGYNFGAFQLWNLNDLKLIYTSSVHKDHIPVSHFSVQVRI